MGEPRLTGVGWSGVEAAGLRKEPGVMLDTAAGFDAVGVLSTIVEGVTWTVLLYGVVLVKPKVLDASLNAGLDAA